MGNDTVTTGLARTGAGMLGAYPRKRILRKSLAQHGVLLPPLVWRARFIYFIYYWARDWRSLALTQVHHGSRLSDSREDGEALSSVHSTALADSLDCPGFSFFVTTLPYIPLYAHWRVACWYGDKRNKAQTGSQPGEHSISSEGVELNRVRRARAGATSAKAAASLQYGLKHGW